MTDMGYFSWLALSVVCAFASALSARSIISRRGGTGAALTLGFATCLGFVSTLPFRTTSEMPWLPGVAAVVFGGPVLSTILCCLCQIREQTKPDTRR